MDTPDASSLDDASTADVPPPARRTPDGVQPSWWLIVAIVSMVVAIIWVAVATPGADQVGTTTSTSTAAAPASAPATSELVVEEDPNAAQAAKAPPEPLYFELSESCTEAVAPIRQLAAATPSGLGLTGEDSERFSEALAAAQEKCGPEEYQRFVEGELGGWLLAPTTRPAS